jgi:hypothetical protein
MQPISPHTLDYVERSHGFKGMVEAVLAGRRRSVRVKLDRFEDDPFTLYACLEYARSVGVSVTFVAARMPR